MTRTATYTRPSHMATTKTELINSCKGYDGKGTLYLIDSDELTTLDKHIETIEVNGKSVRTEYLDSQGNVAAVCSWSKSTNDKGWWRLDVYENGEDHSKMRYRRYYNDDADHTPSRVVTYEYDPDAWEYLGYRYQEPDGTLVCSWVYENDSLGGEWKRMYYEGANQNPSYVDMKAPGGGWLRTHADGTVEHVD